jgi:hypothetical protein
VPIELPTPSQISVDQGVKNGTGDGRGGGPGARTRAGRSCRVAFFCSKCHKMDRRAFSRDVKSPGALSGETAFAASWCCIAGVRGVANDQSGPPWLTEVLERASYEAADIAQDFAPKRALNEDEQLGRTGDRNSSVVAGCYC